MIGNAITPEKTTMPMLLQPENGLPAPAPDFENLLRVLRCERPSRPTLFEFFLNPPLYDRLTVGLGPGLKRCGTGAWVQKLDAADGAWARLLKAFVAAGYDYANFGIPGFGFESGQRHTDQTRSLNEGAVITDRASFDAYEWPNAANANWELLDTIHEAMPPGMKMTISGPCGVLENVISLVGYETLCFLTLDDEPLVHDIFEQVGSRLLDYYTRAVEHTGVGACILNDDWGFNLQTMLSPGQMRTFVFPWHKRIVEVLHRAGKPAILHSCGYFDEVIEDVIEDMKFDGRHSYEDAIVPVEDAYDRLKGRIAVLGGIDMDFMCRRSTEDIYNRSKAMLERATDGGYALGSGNSIPEYVPDESYMAMIQAALETR